MSLQSGSPGGRGARHCPARPGPPRSRPRSWPLPCPRDVTAPVRHHAGDQREDVVRPVEKPGRVDREGLARRGKRGLHRDGRAGTDDDAARHDRHGFGELNRAGSGSGAEWNADVGERARRSSARSRRRRSECPPESRSPPPGGQSLCLRRSTYCIQSSVASTSESAGVKPCRVLMSEHIQSARKGTVPERRHLRNGHRGAESGKSNARAA